MKKLKIGKKWRLRVLSMSFFQEEVLMNDELI
jgi:hypothetical protein